MNNNQKNNITEIEPEEQFLTYVEDSHLIVLIKHDYYSTNDVHGKSLLQSYIESLYNNENEITAIYLVSSGVKVLNISSVADYIGKIIDHHGASVYACSESIFEYGINISTVPFDVNELSAFEIFSEITSFDKVIVIE